MESEVSNIEIFEKFTWKIENFSRLNVNKMYSEPFILGGYPWRILLFPKGNEKVDDHLSIYLEAMQTANMSKGWTRDVKLKFVVFNQLNTNMTITKVTKHNFKATEEDWGFTSFIKLTELRDPEMGFIVKDACIIGAEVFVSNSTLEKPVNHAASLTISLASGSQNGHIMKVEVPMPNLEIISPVSTNIDAEFFSPSIEELMDFSTLGQLEEVCSDTPSLIERPQKRSRTFNDFAFAALGRVLYFLKTRKLKDMNEQACKDLQVLWDELKKFQFDLTWLEPHVQSALGMKSYVEKSLHVEKLKEDMVVLELETERLKTKLGAAEVSLDVERDLLKAKGIKERDLDSELGSGS